MADRLENVIVMHNDADESKAVGVIHRAGDTAVKHRVAKWYDDSAERAKLFKVDDYPLAWGNQKVKADAFLTGVIKLPADAAKTTVVIEAFSAKAPMKMDKVAEFTTDTDRSTLRDLGKSFAVSSRAIKVAKRGIDLDRFVVSATGRRRDLDTGDTGGTGGDKQPAAGDTPVDPPNAATTSVTPDNVGGIQFKILSDGQEAPKKPEKSSADDKWTVECPDETKPVAFSLTNTSDKKLGVVLRLNGISVLMEQKDDAANCRKIIIAPNQTARVQGFITEGEKGPDSKTKMRLSKFKILVGDAAKAKIEELGEKAKEIAIDVFQVSDKPVDEDITVSTRGMKKPDEKSARTSLPSLQRVLMRSAHLVKKEVGDGIKVAKREVIVADTENTTDLGDLKVEDFPNPMRVAGLSIWLTARPGAAPTTDTSDKPDTANGEKP